MLLSCNRRCQSFPGAVSRLLTAGSSDYVSIGCWERQISEGFCELKVGSLQLSQGQLMLTPRLIWPKGRTSLAGGFFHGLQGVFAKGSLKELFSLPASETWQKIISIYA